MAGSKQTPTEKKARVKVLFGGVVFAIVCTVLFFVIMIVISSATVRP